MKRFILVFCFAYISFTAFLNAASETQTLAVLLDVSRSVSPQHFEQIKGIVQALIDQQKSSANLSLYLFGSKLEKIELTKLSSAQATESYTIFYDALYEVLKEQKMIPSKNKAIVIVSDGKDTKSVTIIDDVAAFAREQDIVIHCVGIGRADQKLLERLAKLTGGVYFDVHDPKLLPEIQVALEAKKGGDEIPQPQPETVPEKRIEPSSTPSVATPQKPDATQSGRVYIWIFALLAIIGMGGASVILFRRHRQKRNCLTCGKTLEASQLVCPDCPGQTIMLSTHELPELTEQQPVPSSSEVFQKNQSPASFSLLSENLPKPDTEEIMSRTRVLIEMPTLVVQKGKNVGERYKLSKDNPISIGRSRINEVRLDDPSVSGQHCRIVPKQGEYTLYDLGSTNGTVVNNINVNMAVLEEGDRIRVGSIILLFTLLD